MPPIIYLIHLAAPVHPDRPSRHYLGIAPTGQLAARIQAHRDGRGSPMLRAATARGIAWDVAITWRGTRTDERRLKQLHAAPSLCPLCRVFPYEPRWLRRAEP